MIAVAFSLNCGRFLDNTLEGSTTWSPLPRQLRNSYGTRHAPRASAPGDLLVIPGWGQLEWSTLLSYTQPVELDAGDVLIRPRESDRALFFVTSGRLDVASINEADSSVIPLAPVPAGSVVGELAFFDSEPRSAKAWAVTPARLLRFTLKDYERYASEHASDAPAFLFAMARLLAFRVRRLTVTARP